MLILSIKSLDKITLNLYKKFIKILLFKFKVQYKIINLPTKKTYYTVIKSPHVFKKSKEHFSKHVYKTIVFIKTSNIVFFCNYIILNKIKNINLKMKIIK